ncbi:phage tail protein [Azospirillum argentinense]
MATNDFLPFAGTAGSLVTSQSDWVTLLGTGGALEEGFRVGIANPAQVNKAIRQATTMAAAIGSLVADNASLPALDDGDVPALTETIVRALGRLLAPPGQVSYFAMNTPPAGWLKANGAVVSQTTYADLYAAIGTTFNTGGEGVGNFRLPELRGEFVRSWDDGRGIDSGRALGSWQGDNVHGPAGGGNLILSATDNVGFQGGSTYTGALAGTIAAFSTTAADTRPRNVALLACIRY